MCLLTYLPAGVMPDTAALRNGAWINNDGHGFAIAAGDQLIVQRGLDTDVLIEAFEAARRQHLGGPALFHSRLGTSGGTSIDNCHPFPVGGDTRTVLAHNGVLPSIVRPRNGDARSDTRITAEDFLPTFGPLRTRRARARLERWMTPHNKMVILTVDPRFKKRAFILNESSGTWDGGIWYSNDGYLPLSAQARWELDTDPAWDWPPERATGGLDRCGFCRAVIGVTEDECRYCGWCTGCGEPAEDCYCYTPAALDQRLRPGSGHERTTEPYGADNWRSRSWLR